MSKFWGWAAAFLHFFCHAKAKLRVYDLRLLSYACAFWVNMCTSRENDLLTLTNLLFIIGLIKRGLNFQCLGIAEFRIHKRYCNFKVYTFYYIKSSANDFEEESVFSNRPKTLLYSQNGKAQISISSVSQTKEIITYAGNWFVWQYRVGGIYCRSTSCLRC